MRCKCKIYAKFTLMKKLLPILTLFLLAACSESKPAAGTQLETKNEDKPSALTGNSKDEHGCLGAAGESWSELLQTCVRIFNVGDRLNPTEAKPGEAVISAFILFNEEKSKAEIFLPNSEKKSFIMERDSTGVYLKDSVKYDPGERSIYINEIKKYRAE